MIIHMYIQWYVPKTRERHAVIYKINNICASTRQFLSISNNALFRMPTTIAKFMCCCTYIHIHNIHKHIYVYCVCVCCACAWMKYDFININVLHDNRKSVTGEDCVFDLRVTPRGVGGTS